MHKFNQEHQTSGSVLFNDENDDDDNNNDGIGDEFSVNDQHENIKQNEQELLVTTVKKLANENKRLLKERESFELERLERKNQMDNIKENFISLLTLSQYESNKSKCRTREYLNEKSLLDYFQHYSSKNSKLLDTIDLTMRLPLDFVIKLVKENLNYDHLLSLNERNNSFTNNHVFDCRPFKGPKTPPTPNSKSANKSTETSLKVDCNNAQKMRASVWAVEDMLYYIEKYKNEFGLYSQVINQNNKANKIPKDNPIHQNDAEFKFDNDTNNSTKADDTKFYQNLIDRHKKSLELIENVNNTMLEGNKSQTQNLMQSLNINDNSELKYDNFNKDFLFGSVPEFLALTSLRNQILNNCTTNLLKNPLILNNFNEKPDNNSIGDCSYGNNLPSTNNYDIPCNNTKDFSSTSMPNPNFNKNDSNQIDLGSTTAESQLSQLKDVPKHNAKLPPYHNNKIYKDTYSDENNVTSIDSWNAFEEGEIVDSADETVTEAKNIAKSIEIPGKPKEKSEIAIVKKKFKPRSGYKKKSKEIRSVSRYREKSKSNRSNNYRILPEKQSRHNEFRKIEEKNFIIKTNNYYHDDYQKGDGKHYSKYHTPSHFNDSKYQSFDNYESDFKDITKRHIFYDQNRRDYSNDYYRRNSRLKYYDRHDCYPRNRYIRYTKRCSSIFG